MNVIHSVLLVINLALLTALPTQDAKTSATGSNANARFFGTPDTAGIITADGFPVETHTVIVSGYVLKMFRIPYGRGQQGSVQNRPPVFCMHGMMTEAQAYVSIGPENSLAYNLADAGFDVWLGNARGTRNSRANVYLDPKRDKREFFDFSWEEIGKEDVAGMVDYVLQYTGRKQLHYIGHSQGGTAFLVLNSMRPEYNAKFASANLLAGVGYTKHFPDLTISALATQTDAIYGTSERLGFVELFPPDSTITSATESALSLCTGDLNVPELCDLIGIGSLFEDLPFEYGGCAVKQIAHFGQIIRDGTFRRWNYGPITNLLKYRRLTPPRYDLTRITVNTTMHYSMNDKYLKEVDVLAMAKDMPNTVTRKVSRESFTHNDFLAASDAKQLVSAYIIEGLSVYE